jgi:teichuronic acid biosynthesis glycosyltransferase TuaG
MLFSIIIPYYNDPKNINRAINSVLIQTYKNIEIIVINDDHSELSKKIFFKFLKNKRIKIYSTKIAKSGVAKARNLGIKKAKGKFISFLDSDDYWKKNKLEKQLKLIIKKNLDICFSNFIAVKESEFLYKVKIQRYINYNFLLKECPVCCSSVVIKSIILKKNKFKNLKTKEDYELWLRLSRMGFNMGVEQSILTYYSVRTGTLSDNHLNKIINAFKIYFHFNKFNFFKSIVFVIRLYTYAFIKKYL